MKPTPLELGRLAGGIEIAQHTEGEVGHRPHTLELHCPAPQLAASHPRIFEDPISNDGPPSPEGKHLQRHLQTQHSVHLGGRPDVR
jgi:uncharacterized Zn-finger protein